jgi:phage terminase large subunit
VAGAARILGVDVARFGDDASVIFPWQGLIAFPPLRFGNIDSTQGAGLVARRWTDAFFVDDTGGFGGSWIDNLRRLGHSPIGVPFSSRPNDPRYENKRTEMYFEAVEWSRRGGQLPPGSASHELIAALSQTTYSFRGDRLLLEPKEQVKARLSYSPDDTDAFVLAFAQPVVAGSGGSGYGGRWARPGRVLVDYDVLRG